MGTKLEGLTWVPRWVSQLGCVKGCLDFLKVPISDAWLYGVTGHAFIINVHDALCLSGPTCWKTDELRRLGRNAGYETHGLCACRDAADFEEKVKLAWEGTRQALDEGLPTYAWELAVPEYYVVNGYDDVGYYFAGPTCHEGAGPKPWQELKNAKTGMLEVYSIIAKEPGDDRTAVKEALAFALDHGAHAEAWTWPGYHTGLTAYDAWIAAMENGTAEGRGVAYNAEVWRECREFAAAFMKEAWERLPGVAGAAFEEAAGRYAAVAAALKVVTELFPFFAYDEGHIKDPQRRASAADALRTARAEEAAAVRALEDILIYL